MKEFQERAHSLKMELKIWSEKKKQQEKEEIQPCFQLAVQCGVRPASAEIY